MNILPKKRWHVRTKENIARVRRDEALAAEQAKIEQTRIEKAESEARINFLRNESRKKNNIAASDLVDVEKIQSCSKTPSKHINFFEELEQGNVDYSRPNKEYEKDKKEEQEKYEKQIGYLTYLGQGVKEAVNKCWYNEVPRRLNDSEKDLEIKPNKKSLEDPIHDIKRYLNIISKKETKNSLITKSEKNLHVVSTKNYKNNKNAVENFNKRKHKLSTDDDSNEDEIKSRKHSRKHKKSEKSKKHKRDKKEEIKTNLDIEKLRAERLEREKRERLRAQALLAEMKTYNSLEKDTVQPIFHQKYNSQFFPELARQNCEKNHR